MNFQHPTHVKNIYALLIPIVLTLSVHAQKAEYHTAYDVQYKTDTRLYYLQTTGKPYTGFVYQLLYNRVDTMSLQYYSAGRMISSRTYFAKDQLQSSINYYYFGLKNDSICMEQLAFDQRGDTTSYYVNWVDKKGVKWSRQYVYTYAATGQKTILYYVRTSRFFTKKETKDFNDYSYHQDANYDSAGYSVSGAETGLFIQYYTNGKVMTKGRSAQYEYCVTHGGNFPYYPYSGKTGTWTYYDQDGKIMKEELYDANGLALGVTSYYTSGKVQSRMNYRARFGDLHYKPDGLNLKTNDTVTVVNASWNEKGIITQESFTNSGGDVMTTVFSDVNGRPSSFNAYSNARKPMGVHKVWDEQGRVEQFTNYSDESNDTVCYKAIHGKIISLSLRNKATPINWQLMPYDYYNYGATSSANNYLSGLVCVYQEFYRNGQIKSEVNLKHGTRQGLNREWDSLGTQTKYIYYVDDLAQGQWKEWYNNGQLKKDYTYVNGIRNGTCTDYYSSGAIKWQNTYVNGKPGTPKAYSENGTDLKANTWLTAFYSPACIRNQSASIMPTALHYYFLDTTAAKTLVTIPDSLVEKYSSKVVAAFISATSGYDPCGQANTLPATDGFDAYHSCFIISESIYDARGKAIMNSFFGRHGITIDKTGASDQPLLGLEKEYKIYYSSKEILNKGVVMDSLEELLAPQSGDGKKGYILALDSYQPAAPVIGGGKSSTMTSADGYTTISVLSATYDYTATLQNMTTTLIVYDDLSCDVQSVKMQTTQWQYWPLAH